MENYSSRRSIRLDGFDYASADSYFITICTQHKEHRFGRITDGTMLLNEAGQMIFERILAIPAKFPGTLIDSCVVMPNHVHFILTLLGYRLDQLPDRSCVGAAHRGRPLSDRQGRPSTLPHDDDSLNLGIMPDDSDWLNFSGPIGPKAGDHDGPPLHMNDPMIDQTNDSNDPMIDQTNDSNYPAIDHADATNVPSVADVVGWFKASTTNHYIRGVKEERYPAFDRRLWQRNYYEHIIRTEAAYNQISEYIRTNPVRWAEDRVR
ncbi:transposase [Fibrella aquatica]|uniref:transposase n=1 Tax=Fibrella aquatica TaxID=3242487 RepID=UPI003520C0D4